MRVEEVIDYLEVYFPLSLQEGWDNSGLQISPQDKSIKGILLALDVTVATVEEAKSLDCNLIISHHPLIFSSTKKIRNDVYPFNVAYKAIQYGIGIYAFHTNLDSAKGGLNDFVCGLLELKNVKVFEKHMPLRIGDLNKALSFDEFLNFVKEKLDVGHLKFVKANDNPVKKVAVCTGSCMDLISDIKDLNFDVFLSGDLKHHTAIFAKETNINVVDATHFHTEKFSKIVMFNVLREKFVNQRIFLSSVDRLPWDYY